MSGLPTTQSPDPLNHHPDRLRQHWQGRGEETTQHWLARPSNHDCTGTETCASSVCQLEIAPPAISGTLSGSINLDLRLLCLDKKRLPAPKPASRVSDTIYRHMGLTRVGNSLARHCTRHLSG